ncbi:MAG TPA: ribosomal protein S18-alanine N-acetyltransferase [Paenibacillus sp.]|nr:ribosomal protein S18-alanine N-acetyltransferase [Paenibacillus sp.]
MNAATKPELTFRMMRYEDIPEVCAIELESFATPWSEQAFISELTQNQFAQYIVMEYEERLIGYGGMWIIIDEAHVTNIAVTGEFRGRRLGQRLLTELASRAERLGAGRMTLEVRPSNLVARRLYEKFGFEAVGVRPGYYSDNGEDAIIMWAELPLSDDPGARSSAGM